METFPIVPARLRWIWLAVAVVVVIAGVLALLGLNFGAAIAALSVGVVAFSLTGANRARFDVSASGLRLRGDLYGRFIAASTLRGGAAETLDLRTDRQRQPLWRTWGTAVPGYQSGWYKLQNGERALLYVTDQSRVAYIPTTDGYAVMVSVADPAAFVASVRRIAPAS